MERYVPLQVGFDAFRDIGCGARDILRMKLDLMPWSIRYPRITSLVRSCIANFKLQKVFSQSTTHKEVLQIFRFESLLKTLCIVCIKFCNILMKLLDSEKRNPIFFFKVKIRYPIGIMYKNNTVKIIKRSIWTAHFTNP